MSRPKVCLVTIALGDNYLQQFKQFAETGWRDYCARHGYHLVVFERELDTSARARGRSAAWQKCLVLEQSEIQGYDRVVWVDSDIVIRAEGTPPIDEGVPRDKIGLVHSGCMPPMISPFAVPADYYTSWGLPVEHALFVNTGVLVLTPGMHNAVLRKTYDSYEDRGGPEWHYEQRPLSHEILSGGLEFGLDRRFNRTWPQYLMGRQVAEDEIQPLLQRAYDENYFLHFAGSQWYMQKTADLIF